MTALIERGVEHSFLSGLAPQQVSLIADCATERTFEANEYLIREGEAADKCHLIQEGRVVVRTALPGHHFTTIHILEAGDVVGWSWLTPPYQHQFSAQATQPTRTMTIDGCCLREQCEVDHDLGYELQKRLSTLLNKILNLTKLRLG